MSGNIPDYPDKLHMGCLHYSDFNGWRIKVLKTPDGWHALASQIAGSAEQYFRIDTPAPTQKEAFAWCVAVIKRRQELAARPFGFHAEEMQASEDSLLEAP